MSISGNESRVGSPRGRRALILGVAVAGITIAGSAIFLGKDSEKERAAAAAASQDVAAKASSSAESEGKRVAKATPRPPGVPDNDLPRAGANDFFAKNSNAGGKGGSGDGSATGSQPKALTVQETREMLRGIRNLPKSTGVDDQIAESDSTHAGVIPGSGGDSGNYDPTKPASDPQNQAMILELERQAATDPLKAAARVEALEYNVFRKEATEYVNYQWNKKDAAAAAAWYKKMNVKRY